jgi:hypothetical protein
VGVAARGRVGAPAGAPVGLARARGLAVPVVQAPMVQEPVARVMRARAPRVQARVVRVIALAVLGRRKAAATRVLERLGLVALTTGCLVRAFLASRGTSPVGRVKTNQARLEPGRAVAARRGRELPARADKGLALRAPDRETTTNSTTTIGIVIKARQGRTTGKGISAWPTRRIPATRRGPADPRVQVDLAEQADRVDRAVRAVQADKADKALRRPTVQVKTRTGRALALTPVALPVARAPRVGLVVLALWRASGCYEMGNSRRW